MRWLTTCISLIVIAAFLAGCGRAPEYPRISLATVEPETGETQPASGGIAPLRVALASITSPRESYVYYEELLRYLEKELRRPVQVIQRKTYAEVNNLLQDGSIDLAFVCTYAYVAGHDEFGMQLLVVPEVKGRRAYQSYIIVRRDSGIPDWRSLRGKRFAYSDPLSTSGSLYPRYLVQTSGFLPERFFGETFYTYSHDNSIRAVLDGVADGGAVDSMVFDYFAALDPEVKQRLNIIQRSPDFGMPPVVVRPDLDPALAQKLRDVFTGMDREPEGRKILAGLQIDRYVPGKDSDYDLVRQLGRVVYGGGHN